MHIGSNSASRSCFPASTRPTRSRLCRGKTALAPASLLVTQTLGRPEPLPAGGPLHPSRSACAIRSIANLSPTSRVSSAAVSPAMRITYASPSRRHSVQRSAMSSPCRSAARTIARCTVTDAKKPGGTTKRSSQSLSLATSGQRAGTGQSLLSPVDRASRWYSSGAAPLFRR